MEQEKYDQIRAESRLLDDGMRTQIASVMGKLAQDVWIRAIVDLSDDKSMEMAEFLKAFSAVSERTHLELYESGEAPALEEEMGCEGLYPVTGLYLADEKFSGVSFRGIPGGKEINSFVIAFYNVAGPGQPLEDVVKARIQAIDKNHNMKIFVSLSCHYCAETVILSQHIAALNEKIQVQMTDAGMFPALVEKYNLERVPVMILDEKERLMGGKSMEELLEFLKK